MVTDVIKKTNGEETGRSLDRSYGTTSLVEAACKEDVRVGLLQDDREQLGVYHRGALGEIHTPCRSGGDSSARKGGRT